MSNLRTSTRALTATGLLCFGTVAFIAGCGGGGSSSSPTPNFTPAIVSGVTCASASGGVAYIPDGSAPPNSGISGGGSLTVIPFETTSGSFSSSCPQTKLALPQSINDLAISTQGIAIALQSNNTYIGINQLVNGGTPNTFQNAQPFPSPSGSPFVASSLAIVPNGTTGFAVGQPFQGFVGLNNFFGIAPAALPTPLPSSTPTASPAPSAGGTTPTPTVTQTPAPFAGQVSYSDIASTTGSQSTGLNPVGGTRSSLALASNATTVLVRGVDLAAFSLVSTLAGYYFTFPASGGTNLSMVQTVGINTMLGEPSGTLPQGNLGHGLIAFYPGDSSQAVIGQTVASATTATHVGNLPNGINVISTFTVPSAITSVAVAPSGNYAIIGTTAGLFVENLAASSTTATATTVTSGSINSVGVSPDGNYVLAQIGKTLNVYSFTNGTIGAIAGGSFSLPAATQGDYMVVR